MWNGQQALVAYDRAVPGFQGRIRREDVDAVRDRVHIDEVIGEYVPLKTAGLGSMKGLCPFHDERTPSFSVRPQVGLYHCFGCGESGDVYSFLMNIDHISFAEAVEKLAGRLGYQLRYEEGTSGPDRAEYGRRQRLLDAHLSAEKWFQEQLAGPDAYVGRVFLSERGFDRAAAAQFGVGFAPNSWDGLVSHLRSKGFRDAELVEAGLVSQSQRGTGVYDRFRGRLIWPIRDITGATVGFGARRMLEEDQGPKYLNTPQTRIYNKSQVLYGLDLAKRDIARGRQAVIVEGYTDVMAMHLAGVPRAVATCGTAFGAEHVKVLRRLLMDDESPGQLVFAFDGDAAGQKAAMRAFDEVRSYVAQTFVAVGPDGLDPCDLRLAKGDQALRDLVEHRQSLIEFVLRSTIAGFELNQVEGRVNALRAAAPHLLAVRDTGMRRGYTRELAGWLGMDPEEVRRAVDHEQRRAAAKLGETDRPTPNGQSGPGEHQQRRQEAPANDPVARAERQLLGLVLQFPDAARQAGVERLTESAFTHPAHRMIWKALQTSFAAGEGSREWVPVVMSAAPEEVQGVISALAVRELPMRAGQSPHTLAEWLVLDARKRDLLARERDLDGRAQRLAATGATDEAQALFAELFTLTRERKALDA